MLIWPATNQKLSTFVYFPKRYAMVRHGLKRASEPESIEWFIENHVFSLSRMILHLPHPFPPLPPAGCFSFSVYLCDHSSLLPGTGGGGSEEPNHRKPGPLQIIQSSLVRTHLGIWLGRRNGSWFFPL
jgi:hypothetical protein